MILVEKFSFLTCLNIRQPLKKIERNEWTAAFFFVEFLVVMFLTGLFLLPITCFSTNPEKSGKYFIPLTIFLGLGSCLITSFCLAAFRDPGYVRRDVEIDF